jgi:hypothetical protein
VELTARDLVEALDGVDDDVFTAALFAYTTGEWGSAGGIVAEHLWVERASRFVVHLSVERADAVAARLASSPDVAVPAVIAAAAVHSLGGVCGHDPAVFAAAARWLRDLDVVELTLPWGRVHRERAAVMVAQIAAAAGVVLEGPGGVCDLVTAGVTSLAELDAVGRRAVWSALPDPDTAGVRVEFLDGVTLGGTRPAPVPGLSSLTHIDADVSSAVLVRAYTEPDRLPRGVAGKAARALVAGVTWRAWRDDDAQAAAAFATRPEWLELAAREALSSAAVPCDVPTPLAEASMRQLGVSPWLTASPRWAQRLDDAVAGLTDAHREAIDALIPTFAGTVDELVAVAAEVAPCSAGGPAAAAVVATGTVRVR